MVKIDLVEGHCVAVMLDKKIATEFYYLLVE